VRSPKPSTSTALRELANDFQPAAGFKDQKIVVLQEDFQKQPKAKGVAIKNLLSQVIYNLFENAAKYADADSRFPSDWTLIQHP